MHHEKRLFSEVAKFFLILLISTTNILPAFAVEYVTISVPDANLYAALKSDYWIRYYASSLLDSEQTIRMTTANRDRISYLSLNNKQITDITPLASFTRLSSLNLNDNQISDISPLAYLTGLGTLCLGGGQVTDLSQFANLTNLRTLKTLDLNNSNISDLSPLMNFTSLHSLTLDNNQITDISPLASLTNLSSVSLNHNQISDITPLANLSHLNTIFINHNQISDITPLEHLLSSGILGGIEIRYNQIADIGLLEEYSNNYEISEWDHQDITMPFLGNSVETPFTLYRYMGTKHNSQSGYNIVIDNIDSCDPDADIHIQCIESIENAHFSEDYHTIIIDNPSEPAYIALKDHIATLTLIPATPVGISDPNLYSALKDEVTCAQYDDSTQSVAVQAACNDSITRLSLWSRDISDISPLPALFPNLTELDLYDNQISDISSLSNLNNLEGLDLGDNQISDISPLSNLDQLSWLYLDDNQISDISPLSELNNLEELGLGYNQISDISSLPDNLYWVNLYGNKISDMSRLYELENLNDYYDINYQTIELEYDTKSIESPNVLPYIFNGMNDHLLNDYDTELEECDDDYTNDETPACYESINAELSDDYETITIDNTTKKATIVIHEHYGDIDDEEDYNEYEPIRLTLIPATAPTPDAPKTLDNIFVSIAVISITLAGTFVITRKTIKR